MVLADIVGPGILCIFRLPADEATDPYAVREGVNACVLVDTLAHQRNVPRNEFSDFVQIPDIVAYEVKVDLGQ